MGNFLLQESAEIPFVNFLTHTLVAKYPNAATTILGRRLNNIAPMTTFNYAAGQFMKMLARNPNVARALSEHHVPLRRWFETPEALVKEIELRQTYTK